MPRAHINTPPAQSDKIEAEDKSGQSGFSLKGDWGHSASANDHSVSSITQWLTAAAHCLDKDKMIKKKKERNENFSQSLMFECEYFSYILKTIGFFLYGKCENPKANHIYIYVEVLV